MRATHRSTWRPAHLHFMLSAEGYKTLTTHLFVKGTPPWSGLDLADRC